MRASRLEADPFSVRMVFLRVGWMERYRGMVMGDTIARGGAFVQERGFGHEIFNYLPFEGKVYGYVQAPKAGHNEPGDGGLRLERLGAKARDESVGSVLAVWVATPEQGGALVVGWYRNATLFRRHQQAPPGSPRQHGNEMLGYYVVAEAEDARLLPPDERIFEIPQQRRGGFGQSNVWYADDPDTHREVRTSVLRYIETGKQETVPDATTHPPRQTDPFLRQKVEEAAIKTVVAYYESLGYTVESVEKDNVGWDLNAARGKRSLKLEVKGLSSREAVVELTPNEYAMSISPSHCKYYRICIVCNALTAPELDVFAYSFESGQWESQASGRVLSIEVISGARCRAT